MNKQDDNVSEPTPVAVVRSTAWLSADKNKQIEQLKKQHMKYGLNQERAFLYATNEVNNRDYDKFITTARQVFIGSR